MTREEAYDLLQPKRHMLGTTKCHFRPLLEEDPAITSVLSKEDIDDAFDYRHHLKNVDVIFKRVGLE